MYWGPNTCSYCGYDRGCSDRCGCSGEMESAERFWREERAKDLERDIEEAKASGDMALWQKLSDERDNFTTDPVLARWREVVEEDRKQLMGMRAKAVAEGDDAYVADIDGWLAELDPDNPPADPDPY